MWTASEKAEHNRIVVEVSRQRFTFPSSEHPNWDTHVNEPEHTMGVQTSGDPVYPDIVVVDKTTRTLMMIGEIETAATINAEGAKQWKSYSTVCSSFYLYVPATQVEATRDLLASGGIGVSGLRGYARMGDGAVSISNL